MRKSRIVHLSLSLLSVSVPVLRLSSRGWISTLNLTSIIFIRHHNCFVRFELDFAPFWMLFIANTLQRVLLEISKCFELYIMLRTSVLEVSRLWNKIEDIINNTSTSITTGGNTTKQILYLKSDVEIALVTVGSFVRCFLTIMYLMSTFLSNSQQSEKINSVHVLPSH